MPTKKLTRMSLNLQKVVVHARKFLKSLENCRSREENLCISTKTIVQERKIIMSPATLSFTVEKSLHLQKAHSCEKILLSLENAFYISRKKKRSFMRENSFHLQKNVINTKKNSYLQK